jgi:hypothetical protein
MERLGALVAALSLAACADIMGFEEGQPAPPAQADSASSVASSSHSTAASGGQGGAGGEAAQGGIGGAGGMPETRIAFVSGSAIAIDPQSGLEALDEFCMAEAAAHFPNKEFVAWVSRNAPGAPHIDAKDRIIDAEWYRPDGVRIAASKSDLLDGTLEKPINVKANGNALGTEAVWTGTLASGNSAPYDCEGWLANGPTSSATLGSSGETDGDWTHASGGPCTQSHHIYCFEE